MLVNAAKYTLAKQEGAWLHEQIKEHDRDIRLSRTQTSAVFEDTNKTRHYPLWDEVKFIDRDSHWYFRKVKEAIHIRLQPNNINRDSGIEIPEARISLFIILVTHKTLNSMNKSC